MRLRSLEPHWILVGTFFAAGVFLGSLGVYLWLNATYPQLQKIHGGAGGGYKYINPLLAVELIQSEQFAQNRTLQPKMEGLINARKADGAITKASIYFRDLEPGIWAGVSQDNKFSPGRLLKIPIMIAYFKLAQNDPSVLQQNITFYGKDTGNMGETMRNGQTYTAEELIRRMIVFSNDQAANLLFDNIDKSILNEVFSDLSIDFKEDKGTADFISVKLYSLFYRVLYNSTYLEREYSEKALGLLAESNNPFGLAIALPKDVPIANLLGYRSVGKNLLEVFDCGIVYYPKHPYLLCVTAQGGHLDRLKSFLKEVSTAIYEEMNYQYH